LLPRQRLACQLVGCSTTAASSSILCSGVVPRLLLAAGDVTLPTLPTEADADGAAPAWNRTRSRRSSSEWRLPTPNTLYVGRPTPALLGLAAARAEDRRGREESRSSPGRRQRGGSSSGLCAAAVPVASKPPVASSRRRAVASKPPVASSRRRAVASSRLRSGGYDTRVGSGCWG
jgi:hypothetical protein